MMPSPDSSSLPPDNELWHDDYPLELMLGLLVRRLAESGPMDDDQAARLCLTARELAGLLPMHEKLTRSQDTAEGLASFLEDETPEVKPLASAIRDWRVSVEMIRWRFGWLEIPPALRKRAHRRARTLVLEAEGKGWVTLHGQQWQLTDEGQAVAQASSRE